MRTGNPRARRNLLKAAGAGLISAALPSGAAEAPSEAGLEPGEQSQKAKPVYLHGCGWNRDLPGIFGQLCLTFEMRAMLNGGGVGTFRDDVYPEVNSQFQIDSARRIGRSYTFDGHIISSRDPYLLGMTVKIVATRTGPDRGNAVITVGSEDRDLVVIAIIAVLIGLLLPPVQ